jgi:hypothetical protein
LKEGTSSTGSDYDFVRHTCDRYHNHHRFGERIPPDLLSKQEMTVADILYSYTQRVNFTDVSNWDGIGYCFHSDWAWGYFPTEYHITLDGQVQVYQNKSIDPAGMMHGECLNEGDDLCNADAIICHYVTPNGMIERMKNPTPELKKLLSGHDHW